MDLDAYRAEAETFVTAISREHYRHFAGFEPELRIEPIYDAHPGLFSRAAVDGLREAGVRSLLEFAVEGLIERATKAEAAQLARTEAALDIEVDGEPLPFRQAPVVQANEPDPDRRAAIGAARDEATERELQPMLRATIERSHALVHELGWPSMTAMCAETSGIDLESLARAGAALLDATEELYEPVVEPQLREELGFGFEHLRRSDLPAFFRAPSLDERFPSERLMPSFAATLAGMEIDANGRVVVDAEARATKSPRAFCAPVRVPDEVYLVIAPHGGRDDYEALLHEAGHAQHYGHVDPALAFEHRYLGDNSITEAFAFLFQRLVAEPEWLRRRLGVDDPEPTVAHARAAKLVFLRRYAAKLGYELELHGARMPLDELRADYARRLSAAVHVDWPAATWLSDVDPFFYAARYLRAWALEARMARALTDRFGAAWFDEPAAGVLLRRLWSSGQRAELEELLADVGAAGTTSAAHQLAPLLEELEAAA